MQLLYVERGGKPLTSYLVKPDCLAGLIQGQNMMGCFLTIQEVPKYLTPFLIGGWTEDQWFEPHLES